MSEEDKKLVEKTEKIEAQVGQDVPAKKSAPSWLPWVGGGAVVVVLFVAAYLVGMQAGKGKSTTLTRDDGFSSMARGNDNASGTATMPSGAPSGDFRSGRGMGTIGTVTAISSDSITIKDTQRGGMVTFTIDSSTKVTSGTTTKAVSDITTGATVRIQASTSDTIVAGTIAIQS